MTDVFVKRRSRHIKLSLGPNVETDAKGLLARLVGWVQSLFNFMHFEFREETLEVSSSPALELEIDPEFGTRVRTGVNNALEGQRQRALLEDDRVEGRHCAATPEVIAERIEEVRAALARLHELGIDMKIQPPIPESEIPVPDQARGISE